MFLDDGAEGLDERSQAAELAGEQVRVDEGVELLEDARGQSQDVRVLVCNEISMVIFTTIY